jgi:hypothetical protein
MLQKTLDILGQLQAAVNDVDMPPRRAERMNLPDLLERLAATDALVRRGVVEESYRWALSGPPDAEGEVDDNWDAATAPLPAPTRPDRTERSRKPPAGGRKRGRGRLRPKRFGGR